jgi:dienelactone hydrolase
VSWCLGGGEVLFAQTRARQVSTVLEQPIETPDVVAFQLREYLLKKTPKLPTPASAEQWTAESKRLRRQILDEVVFHGWPREWVNAPLKVEDLGLIPSGKGYRTRKLRYEIVPGFYSTAILYEPEKLGDKTPAILNVNGHVGAPGKAVEYKQKRCINQALQGFLSLNLEWLYFGELTNPENAHWYGAHLDLVGANGVGLFYLAMRKGLDYLYEHPKVDRSRIGVTGLSGGGWQTIFLSALDERVQAAAPVAGYSAFISRVERPADTGDIEQNPTDLLLYGDYTHLTAMRAPRPTLLMYNAEDDCCFRAPLVKPYIFDDVKPFFRLYGREDVFGWHENRDPADHNYQLDNRLQSYRFFTKNLGLPVAEKEVPVDGDVKTVEELAAGIPADNLTILGLAKRLAARIERGRGDREALKRVVRYHDVAVAHAWALNNSKNKGLETKSYRLDFGNGLTATGVWLKAIATPADAPATIVINDAGRKASVELISDRLNRGEQVLALDLVFTGDAAPQKPAASSYAQMLSTIGERALGIEAAQLVATARWLGAGKRRVEATGPRSQVAALTAAAIAPGQFAEVVIHDGMDSLRHLLEAPVAYQNAPELFCLDFYKEFDIDRLRELGR